MGHVKVYLAAGSEDNTAYDLSLHVGARPCYTLGASWGMRVSDWPGPLCQPGLQI